MFLLVRPWQVMAKNVSRKAECCLCGASVVFTDNNHNVGLPVRTSGIFVGDLFLKPDQTKQKYSDCASLSRPQQNASSNISRDEGLAYRCADSKPNETTVTTE